MPVWLTTALSLAANFFGAVGKALGLVHDAEERYAGRQSQAVADDQATIKDSTDAQVIASEDAGLTDSALDDKLRKP